MTGRNGQREIRAQRKIRRVAMLTLVIPVVALLGYAWTDGGRQPVRDIVQPLPVPRAGK